MIAVILSGGSGVRLWPLSRESYPKQFLSLNSSHSLFQETILRLGNIDRKMVICNQENRFLVAQNLHEISERNTQIILEPCARNTAPAIAVAAFFAMQNGEDPILLVVPSDHVINDVNVFGKAIEAAKNLAESGLLVTFGVVPTHANTEYGYIECGDKIDEVSAKIASFREKPNQDVAGAFIKNGNYLWNSGMFMFKASKYLEELGKNHPQMHKWAKESVAESQVDMDFIRLAEYPFAQCENISIDYAIMEKTSNAAVVKLDALWSDVGSWASLWEISQKDSANNVCKGDVVIEDCKNNYFYAEDKLVTAIGVENLIVIDTKDALLVADKSAGTIRKIVAKLQSANRRETKAHRVVYRPWGHFDTIYKGEREVVKRIIVNVGAKLSRQMHNHRAEHWVVVKGSAKVVRGEEILFLKENESVYLPVGITHSLENIGKSALEIIEIQTGDYLGEDDIIRFEDLYGRVLMPA